MAWTFTRACKRHLNAHARVLSCSRIFACTHKYIYSVVQLLHQQDNGGKIETTDAGESTKQREVVKDSLGIDKLPVLRIFS